MDGSVGTPGGLDYIYKRSYMALTATCTHVDMPTNLHSPLLFALERKILLFRHIGVSGLTLDKEVCANVTPNKQGDSRFAPYYLNYGQRHLGVSFLQDLRLHINIVLYLRCWQAHLGSSWSEAPAMCICQCVAS